MQLVQQIVIRKIYTRYKGILDLCHKSKNPYDTGPYDSKSGLINADVNGAINIMRKVSGDEIECLSPASRGFVFNPVRIEISYLNKPFYRFVEHSIVY